MATSSQARTSTELALNAVAAVNSHDVGALGAVQHPDLVEEFLPVGIYTGREEVKGFFSEMFAAMPNVKLQVHQTTAEGNLVAIQWRSSGRFDGGPFQGIDSNGAEIAFPGCDLMEFRDGRLYRNTVFYDGATFARQVGLIPPDGSRAERAMKAAFNLKTRVGRTAKPTAPSPVAAAPGVPDTDATAGEVARSYFAAAAARDAAAMAAHWLEDGIDDFTISGPMRGPAEVRAFFEEVFGAIPDFDMRVERVVEEEDRAAVLWRGTGHFSGAHFQGIAPTGSFVEQRGLDVLEVEDGRLRHNTAYSDGLTMARQFGMLPPAGSAADRAMTKAFNLKTRLGR